MSEFKREERYIVVKLKHLVGLQIAPLRNFLRENRVPTLDCVVVEQDWPEYEKVWRSIEGRMTGQPAEDFDRVTAERDALQALLTAADERADVLTNALNEAERVLGCYAPPTHKALKLISAALKLADGGGDEYRKSCEAAHKALSMENQRITPVQTETREDAIERLFGRFGDGE